VYTRAENEFVLEMMAAGRIEPSPMITHRVSLAELPAAFESLRRPTDQCKVLLVPG
jgi:(R,R)-butanediol dehydrogenase/meso-butanediol dehydrogenase/diacetyl reductase